LSRYEYWLDWLTIHVAALNRNGSLAITDTVTAYCRLGKVTFLWFDGLCYHIPTGSFLLDNPIAEPVLSVQSDFKALFLGTEWQLTYKMLLQQLINGIAGDMEADTFRMTVL